MEFSGEIPEPNPTFQIPTTPGITSQGYTTPATPNNPPYDAGDIYSLFRPKTPPISEPIYPENIPRGYQKIDNNEKENMAKLDIDILKRILAQENALSSDENKKIIRNIFFRMTDESLYEDDKDIHVFLLPYIEDDIAFIVEGRNQRPLIVISMYYLECRKVKRNIEKTRTDKTCGLWLTKLIGNYQQMRNLEIQYNTIANHDIAENSNNRCAAGIVDQESLNTTLENLNLLNTRERAIMETATNFKKENASIEDVKINIERNTNEMRKIYEYDYNNDHRIKMLKKFKGRRGPYTIIENGVEREEIVGYNTMRSLKI